MKTEAQLQEQLILVQWLLLNPNLHVENLENEEVCNLVLISYFF